MPLTRTSGHLSCFVRASTFGGFLDQECENQQLLSESNPHIEERGEERGMEAQIN